MKHEQLPIAFKVRTQGRYTGAKGGEVKPGGGGAGALWYEDKTFTVATHQDQWLLAPVTHGTPNTFPMSPANHQGPKLKYLSVCSGMEAASVAWHPLGWEPVGFSEIEPFPAAILAHRFPNTPNHGDLTKHAEWPLEPGSIDLLVGGTPCQSFSVAGLRKGMSDPRGNLALTFLGLADRLRPRWIVWENVPGVLSSNGGRDFGAFLGALGQLGYGWAYRVLDAQHFGVPQRRRRVFVVATSSGDGRLAGEVLSLPEGLRGYLEARRKKGQGAPSGPAGGVDADGEQGSILWNGSDQPNAERLIDKAGTLNCNKGQRGGYIVPAKPIVIDRAAFNQGENALYDPVIEETDTCPTIIQRGPHAVQPPIPFRKAKRAQSDKDDESWVEGEVSNTLNNFDLGDTRTTHAVVEPQPFSVAFGGAKLEEISPTVVANGGPNRHGEGSWSSTQFTGVVEPVAKQGAHHTNYVADLAPSVSTGAPFSKTGNERVESEAIVAQPMAVRRLTPVECERLQGFPDNWSRIPWKGKPEEDCPDGPRYKACGNSMAVPVMRWIGTRIAAVEARHAAKAQA